MAKQLLAYLLCLGTLLSVPPVVMGQPREAESQTNVQGTVEAVDYKARTVTLRGVRGGVVTLDVPPEAMRFEQVKVGDTVTATYYDRVSLRPKPAGEPPVDRIMEPTTVGTPGALPGATRTRQRITTVTITGWDPANRVVSFTTPNGTAYSRGLMDTTDAKIIEDLKVGSSVDVTRTEAVTVAGAAGRDDRRHVAKPPHVLGPVRLGQPVQREGDQGSRWSNNGRGANQTG